VSAGASTSIEWSLPVHALRAVTRPSSQLDMESIGER
jgi:hypothetical protein